MNVFGFLGFVFLVIFFSGVISGTEAAVLSVSYAKAKELGRRSGGGRSLLRVKENLHYYIIGIVLLNNFVNIVGSMYVGFLATQIFGSVYIGLVSGVMTFLVILFAEVVPKRYGERYRERMSLFVARPLVLIGKILFPFIFVLDFLSDFFVRDETKRRRVSEGEIREMALLGTAEGSIDVYESKIIKNVFAMNDIEAYEIMIPRRKVEVVDLEAGYKKVLKIAKESGFTRFPVVSQNEVIGLINVKDLFVYYGRESKFRVGKILRPIVYAPEGMKIVFLEQKLKKERIHMAAIVNEHGDFVGIVTLEDVIEELLGDIEDEFDEGSKRVLEKIGENTYRIGGEFDFRELNVKFDLGVSFEDGDFTTLNGFLVKMLGRIPKVNDKVKLKKAKFRVIKANRKRVIEAEIVLKKGRGK